MSITTGDFRSKITASTLLEKKQRHELITCLTAYDYASARLVDEAGIDMILVGDSLGHGGARLREHAAGHHAGDAAPHPRRAPRREARFPGCRHAVRVLSRQLRETLRNASRFIKDGGAEAVKIEGGEKRARLVETPGRRGNSRGRTHRPDAAVGARHGRLQSAGQDAGRGRATDARRGGAGARRSVLHGAGRHSARGGGDDHAELDIPTIGIGAGPDCDGQVLVFHDLLGLTFAPPAKFVRRYADVGAVIRDAVHAFKDDVKSGEFPRTPSRIICRKRRPRRWRRLPNASTPVRVLEACGLCSACGLS